MVQKNWRKCSCRMPSSAQGLWGRPLAARNPTRRLTIWHELLIMSTSGSFRVLRKVLKSTFLEVSGMQVHLTRSHASKLVAKSLTASLLIQWCIFHILAVKWPGNACPLLMITLKKAKIRLQKESSPSPHPMLKSSSKRGREVKEVLAGGPRPRWRGAGIGTGQLQQLQCHQHSCKEAQANHGSMLRATPHL